MATDRDAANTPEPSQDQRGWIERESAANLREFDWFTMGKATWLDRLLDRLIRRMK